MGGALREKEEHGEQNIPDRDVGMDQKAQHDDAAQRKIARDEIVESPSHRRRIDRSQYQFKRSRNKVQNEDGVAVARQKALDVSRRAGKREEVDGKRGGDGVLAPAGLPRDHVDQDEDKGKIAKEQEKKVPDAETDLSEAADVLFRVGGERVGFKERRAAARAACFVPADAEAAVRAFFDRHGMSPLAF